MIAVMARVAVTLLELKDRILEQIKIILMVNSRDYG